MSKFRVSKSDDAFPVLLQKIDGEPVERWRGILSAAQNAFAEELSRANGPNDPDLRRAWDELTREMAKAIKEHLAAQNSQGAPPDARNTQSTSMSGAEMVGAPHNRTKKGFAWPADLAASAKQRAEKVAPKLQVAKRDTWPADLAEAAKRRIEPPPRL